MIWDFKIGTSYVGCPTCADDIMLCAKSEQEAQTQLYIIEQCTSDDRVKINSKKTEIIRINDNKAKNKPLTLFKETISEKISLKHLGIERQKNNIPDIEKRIYIARGTMYSLMGAGLHGINGIHPLIAWQLWRTFVVPRMLYEIETLKITTTDIYKLVQFQKKDP